MTSIRAMFFDVFGTLVDWRTGVAREADRTSGPGHRLDWTRFADAWRDEYQPGMEEVRSGRIPFSKLDVLHRRNLERFMPRSGLKDLPEATRRSQSRLAPAGRLARRNRSARAIAQKVFVGAVSNGNIALMADLARRNGLHWDAILGSEVAGDYKPKPIVYLAACEAFDLEPAQCMMVATHSRDLVRCRMRAADGAHYAAR